MGVPTCVPLISAEYLRENAARSMLYVAVRQKTCASAIQPNRSSRCGQSVGTPTKFDRCPQRILLHSLLIISLPDLSFAVNGKSVCSTSAATNFGSGALFGPVISRYRNP